KFASELAGQLVDGIRDVRKWYAFKDKTYYVAFEGTPLTSVMIMEIAATVAEMELLPDSIWKVVAPDGAASAWHQRLDRLLNGDYGVPLWAFLSKIEQRIDRLEESLPTFDAICIISLSPQLPPFVMHP